MSGNFSGYAFYPETQLGDKDVIAQEFIPDHNCLLKVVRAWVLTYGDPQFTSLRFKIYSDREGSPGELLATSNARIKADIDAGDAYSVRNLYFDFDDAIPLASGDSYYLVLDAVGASSFTETSHVTWLQWYYQPVYATAPDFPADAPFSCAFITADL